MMAESIVEGSLGISNQFPGDGLTCLILTTCPVHRLMPGTWQILTLPR